MASLQSFWAFDNLFSGTLPTELGKLTTLSELDLSKNTFANAFIPSEWGGMNNLRTLLLGNNSGIGGGIPTELGQLRYLTHLDVLGTSVSGMMPTELCALVASEQLTTLLAPCSSAGFTCDCCTNECPS